MWENKKTNFKYNNKKGKVKYMATTIKDALLDCEDIVSDIMDKVSNELTENNVEFIHTNKSEIIVENSNKDNIINIILNIDELDHTKIKLLLQITESNGNVFIRQKFN